MKKIILAALCALVAVSSALGRDKGESFFYRSGFIGEVDVQLPVYQDMSNYVPWNATLGLGGRVGNGFDVMVVAGCNTHRKLGVIGISYLNLRYHFFDSRYSPYVSGGIGANYIEDAENFAPTVRASAGVSFGIFSVYFSVVENFLLWQQSTMPVYKAGVIFSF